MSGFFDRIANSFSSNSSKKLLNEILSSKYELQAKYEPMQLKRILHQKGIKQHFLKQLSTPETLQNNNSLSRQNNHTNIMFKALKKISVFHHVVLYYQDFTELIQVVQFDKLIEKLDDCWFVNTVMKPYICFLKKYCLGIEMYQKLRSMPMGSKQTIFQCMCYAINMLKSLFNVVTKLPAIGRYFRQKFPKTVDYFVELMAYQAQQIYQGFRSCIAEIISFSKDHLPKKQDETIFKQILSVDLPWVNEQMKKLFLDKYFYPYGKGYGVKLYRIQDQNQYQLQVINGIMNDHQCTQRRKQAKMMQETLFPTNISSTKFNQDDLERSFSFSISKLQYLRKDKKDIQDPQKQHQVHDFNKTVGNLQIGNKNRQKRIDFTSVKVSYEEEVVDDI